jgi:hypothetical protein
MKSAIKSTLRVYWSADLSGSASFKFDCEKKGKLWSNIFAQYYRRLEANFINCWFQLGKSEYAET